MHVLVLNCGSSSLKYQLKDTETQACVVAGAVERIEDGAHKKALADVIEATKEYNIEAVGHRVVHGGHKFSRAVEIDTDVIAAIEACIPLAPLHNPPALACIRASREAFADVPHVAVFDTAFHATLPNRAKNYAIDPNVAEERGLYRYGFHGPSHAFVAREAARALNRPLAKLRLITLHLGNGCSATAVECGRSVETSMGTTPLEGLVMGTRSGDIDAGAVLQLLNDNGEAGAMSAADVDELLNKKSGLLGLSGESNDLRDIQKHAEEGDKRARLALGVFAHRVRKYIGAYAATMGGVDAIVLTGGIGENSAQMRRRILQRFEFLGLVIDEDRNTDAEVSAENRASIISADHAGCQAIVVATDEEQMIAESTAAVVSGATKPTTKKPIPIAVSARHIHLTAETFAALFGEGKELTPYKPLSQPGQYASEEKLSLIGPRNRIDGVRILGPLRPKNQVEISRTDEFFLGVDAPVRLSGRVEGSAPITLEGPKGRVTLSEGLICAWRHIHMRPEDAKAYGVKHGDSVEVKIHGGVRDLTFGDVLVRVSEKYALEMHIDTDEANAAELSRKSEGMLVGVEGGAQAVVQARRAADSLSDEVSDAEAPV